MKLSFTPTAILLSCTLALIPTSAFAQFSGSQGNANASGDNQEQLNSATVDFRTQQLKLLRDRNKKSAPAPVVAPK